MSSTLTCARVYCSVGIIYSEYKCISKHTEPVVPDVVACSGVEDQVRRRVQSETERETEEGFRCAQVK